MARDRDRLYPVVTDSPYTWGLRLLLGFWLLFILVMAAFVARGYGHPVGWTLWLLVPGVFCLLCGMLLLAEEANNWAHIAIFPLLLGTYAIVANAGPVYLHTFAAPVTVAVNQFECRPTRYPDECRDHVRVTDAVTRRDLGWIGCSRVGHRTRLTPGDQTVVFVDRQGWSRPQLSRCTRSLPIALTFGLAGVAVFPICIALARRMAEEDDP
jgi:hypothetical protein